MIKILTSLALLSTLLHADDFLDKSIDVTFPEAIGKLQLVTKKAPLLAISSLPHITPPHPYHILEPHLNAH